MPLLNRNVRPRWAYNLLCFYFCLAGLSHPSVNAAGVHASEPPSGATTATDASGVAAPENYEKFSSLNEAAAYPADLLQQRAWRNVDAEQPFESQAQQSLDSESPHVFFESLPQQQQGFADTQESGSRSDDVSFNDSERWNDTAFNQKTPPAALPYPQRVALLSQQQRLQQSKSETAPLQTLKQQDEPSTSEKQQTPSVMPALRPVKHHYTVRFPPQAEPDSFSSTEAQPTSTAGVAVGTQETSQPATAGETTTPSATPPSPAILSPEQPTWQGQESQTQGGTEGLQIPFFSALPENKWDYKQHGKDWTSTCAEGRRQSPVDLHIEGLQERQYRNLTGMYRRAFSGGEADFLASALSSRRPWRRGDFFYFYPNSFPSLQVYRSSKVFQLRAANSSMMALGALFPTDSAEMLTAQHIFFHSPSEHTFQGEANRREVEMQIWHFSNDPITFRASTEVNRTALPYLALFAEGSLGLPPQGVAEEIRSRRNNVLLRRIHKAEAAISTGSREEKNASQATGTENADTVGRRQHEIARGESTTAEHTAPPSEGETQGVDNTDTDTYDVPEEEVLSAVEMRATVTHSSAAAARAPHANTTGSGGAATWSSDVHNGNQEGKPEEQGDLQSPTAHWRVIALTFMSEELDQATVQDLKSLPSERLISSLLQAELIKSTGKPGGETIKLKEPLNLQSLMMMLQLSNTEFFAYDGSSTMPPCQENVRWYVARQPLPVATETMLRFYKMLNPSPVVASSDKDGNFRSLQNVEFHRMHNEGNVYLVQGFPLQLLVAASLGFDAMARLPLGEAPALKQFFNLSSSAASLPLLRSTYTTLSSLLLLLLVGFSAAELLDT